jgi:hypothetical protein
MELVSMTNAEKLLLAIVLWDGDSGTRGIWVSTNNDTALKLTCGRRKMNDNADQGVEVGIQLLRATLTGKTVG